MAKQSNVRTHPRHRGALVTPPRYPSHKAMEVLILLIALGILFVLFAFFTLTFQSIFTMHF